MAYGTCLNCGKLGHSMADCHDTPPAGSAQGFEIWATGKKLSLRKIVDGSRYESMETQYAWLAWEASKAASRSYEDGVRDALKVVGKQGTRKASLEDCPHCDGIGCNVCKASVPPTTQKEKV